MCFFSFCQIDYFFFFSSRRRHTRWPRDWSSDVCSSDLLSFETGPNYLSSQFPTQRLSSYCREFSPRNDRGRPLYRSEERRVGKECRDRWGREHEKKRRKVREE